MQLGGPTVDNKMRSKTKASAASKIVAIKGLVQSHKFIDCMGDYIERPSCSKLQKKKKKTIPRPLFKGPGNNWLWFNGEDRSWNISSQKKIGSDNCYLYTEDTAKSPEMIKNLRWSWANMQGEWPEVEGVTVEELASFTGGILLKIVPLEWGLTVFAT